jgi:hypothetical protein
MKIPSPNGMTLRQKLMEADRLTRELMDHLERGFVPKVHNLRRVTRHGSEVDNETVTDLTVRSTADLVLDSASFTAELAKGLEQFLTSIDAEIGQRGK